MRVHAPHMMNFEHFQKGLLFPNRSGVFTYTPSPFCAKHFQDRYLADKYVFPAGHITNFEMRLCRWRRTILCLNTFPVRSSCCFARHRPALFFGFKMFALCSQYLRQVACGIEQEPTALHSERLIIFLATEQE